MDTIGLLKQKGGAGATTLAVHLALAAAERGRRPVLVDVDPQGSAASWGAARAVDLPPVIAATAGQLPALLEAARADRFDLVLIDTPPHSSAVTEAVAGLSSLAVIPTRPSALDLAALPAVLEIVERTRTPHLVVLNACPARACEVEEARELLESGGAPLWKGQIGDRTAYRRAIALGQSVTEVEPHGKATSEIRALWKHIDSMLVRYRTRKLLK